METPPASSQPDRREFCKKAGAILAGGIVMAIPTGAGALVLLDPLRQKTSLGESVRIAPFDSLPENGEPRKFSVLATRVDAWNRTTNVPVGAVYLRRVGADRVQAFNVVCPHAGCFVDFDGARQHYHCPCHNSSFDLEGRVSDPKSPSPRGLDELPVEIRAAGEIWVTFRNFRAGVKEQVIV